MGVQISELVTANELALDELFDRRIAIDAFNWLYQFLSIIRQKDGQLLMDSHGRVTSHLSGLFYRTTRLLEAGIKPVYVFDGEPPLLKEKTAQKRRDVREEAMQEWKEALEREDFAEAKKHAMRSSTLDDKMINDSKELLTSMGVPWLQAPSEGEALCSAMAKRGDVYAVATQDYDSLLFGAPRLIRNLSVTGKRRQRGQLVDVKPEIIILNDMLEKLGINQTQLVILGILIGTDYNPGGVKGYGPKRALELVKEKKTLQGILQEITWDFDAAPEEIYEFFLHAPKDEYNIEFNEPDTGKIKKILCDEHEFSEDRVDSALGKIREKKGQSGLGRWM